MWLIKKTDKNEIVFNVLKTEEEKILFLKGLSPYNNQIIIIPEIFLQYFMNLKDLWNFMIEPNLKLDGLTPIQFLSSESKINELVKKTKLHK